MFQLTLHLFNWVEHVVIVRKSQDRYPASRAISQRHISKEYLLHEFFVTIQVSLVVAIVFPYGVLSCKKPYFSHVHRLRFFNKHAMIFGIIHHNNNFSIFWYSDQVLMYLKITFRKSQHSSLHDNQYMILEVAQHTVEEHLVQTFHYFQHGILQSFFLRRWRWKGTFYCVV